jgi:LPXTG-motif cell wall-anchored protein
MTAVAIFDPIRPAEPVQAQTTSGSLFCAGGLPCTTSSLYDAPLQDRLQVTGGDFDRLVRGSAADAWGPIESQARALVSSIHQVPNDDRLLSVGRDSVRAMMLILLLGILDRAEAGEVITPEEQLALDAFEDALRVQRTEAARLAVAEYDRWAFSPCTYRVPAGFGFDEYGTVPCGGITAFAGPPPPPSIEQFQAYGAARANESLLEADAAAALQRLELALAYSFGLAAGIASGVLAGVIASTIPALGFGLAVAIGSGSAAQIGFFTIAGAPVATAAGVATGGVIIAASVVAIIIIATLVTVLGAIKFAENARVRPALVESLDAASTVDLAATAATESGRIELAVALLSQTLPDLPAERVTNATAPTAWSPGNPEWSVLHPDGTRTRQAVLTTYAWDGRAQETFMSEGYFVTRRVLADGSWSPWNLSLTLEHFTRVDGLLVQRTVGISRDTLIVLDPAGGTTPPPGATFQPAGFLFNGGSVATVSITGNLPPSLAPTLSSQPVIGTPFTFIANESDSDDDPVTVEWYIEDPTKVVAAGDVSLCGLQRIVPATLENILTPRCPWPAYAGSSVTLTYGQAGTFGALAVATDSQGVRSSQRFTFTVAPVPPTLNVTGGSTVRILTEGNTTTIAGSVVYPGPTTGYDRPTLHVDWGDGTTSRLCAPFTEVECPLELSGGPLITEPRPFSIDHVYVHDPRRPIPTNMTIKVWAVVPSGARTPVVEIPVALNRVAPSVTLNPNTCTPEVVLCLGDLRGRTTVITGRIDDVVGSTHRVSVDWGDGTSDILTPGCTDAGCPGTVPPWGVFFPPSPPLTATYFQLRHDYAPSDVPYEAKVTVWDGGPVIGPTVPLTIAVVNRPPAVSDKTALFGPGEVFFTLPAGGLLATAADPDGDLLTAELTTPPAQGTVSVNPNGAWSFSAGDASGDQSFTFTVRDQYGGTAIGTVDLQFVPEPPNRVPVAEEQVVSVKRGVGIFAIATAPGEGGLNDQARDPDGDLLTFSLEEPAALGAAQVFEGGGWRYTPGQQFGEDRFTYRATDPDGASVVGTVRVEIVPNEPNRAPFLTSGPISANVAPGNTVGGAAPGVLTGAFDQDFDPIGAALGAPPAQGLAVVDSSGAWTYTADGDATGTDSFGFVVSDDRGLTATGTVNITIDPPADAPVVTPRTITTPIGVPVSEPAPGLLGAAIDPDGRPLRAALVTPPTKGTVDVFPDGAWSFTPDRGASGADSFTFAVINDGGGTTNSTMQLVIGALDPPPTDPTTPPTDPSTTVPAPTDPPTTDPPTTVPAVPVGTVPPGLPPLGATPPVFTTTILGVSSSLRQGERVAIALPPGTREHRVAIYSTPVVLASGGAGTGVEIVIPTDTTPGRHTLVMWALVGDDVQVSGLVVDVIDSQPSGRLPETGSSPWSATAVALLLLVLGIAIVMATRRRHRLTSEPPFRQ